MRSLGRSAIEEVEVDYPAVIGSRDGPLGVDPSEPASGILDIASAPQKKLAREGRLVRSRH